MTPPPTPPSPRVGRGYWIVVVIVVILGQSLLLSYDFSAGAFGPNTWSNFIAGVQLSTLIGVVGILWLLVRSRGS